MIQDIFQTTLPETIIVLGLILFPLFEIFKGKNAKLAAGLWSVVLLSTLGALFYLLGDIENSSRAAFAGHFVIDVGLLKIKILLVLIALPAAFIGEKYFMDPPKYYLLLLATVYGGMLLISSGSFISVFMGLELMNIPFYALILNGPQKEKAYEASMKYLFIDGIVTASFLMGLVLVYYDTGSIALNQALTLQGELHAHAHFGYLVIILSFFTKLTLAPFHFWGPDVNEGSSLRIVYAMGTLPKLALMYVIWKISAGLFQELSWRGLLMGFSLLSIFWGNIAAYKQKSLKRFLAYSAVAQFGYLLLVFLTSLEEQLDLTLLFFALYAPVLLLFIWGTEKLLGKEDRLEALEGLGTRKVLLSLPLLFGLLSFAGIPPFPGFFAKIAIMFSVIKAGYPALAVAAFVGSYFGIYAYFRLIVSMFLGGLSKKQEA